MGRCRGAPGASGKPFELTSGDGAGVGYDSALPRLGVSLFQPLYIFIADTGVFACCVPDNSASQLTTVCKIIRMGTLAWNVAHI
jgi:hypothetical protein